MLKTKGFPFVDPIDQEDLEAVESGSALEGEPLTEEDYRFMARREMRRLSTILIEEFKDGS